ncbi:hypothetical protein S245_023593, partial [Arachis hypogaea]
MTFWKALLISFTFTLILTNVKNLTFHLHPQTRLWLRGYTHSPSPHRQSTATSSHRCHLRSSPPWMFIISLHTHSLLISASPLRCHHFLCIACHHCSLPVTASPATTCCHHCSSSRCRVRHLPGCHFYYDRCPALVLFRRALLHPPFQELGPEDDRSDMAGLIASIVRSGARVAVVVALAQRLRDRWGQYSALINHVHIEGLLVKSVQNNFEESINKPLWKFVTKKDKIEGGGNLEFQCKFCKVLFNGSYTRVRAHLLKISGKGIRFCVKVTLTKLEELKKLDSESTLLHESKKAKSIPLPPLSNVSELDLRKRRATRPLEKAFN